MNTSTSQDRTLSADPDAAPAPINRLRPTPSCRPAHALTASPTRSRLTPWQVALAVLLAGAALLLLLLGLLALPTAASRIEAPGPIPSAQPAPPPPPSTAARA